MFTENEQNLQIKIENLFKNTCGSFQNCTESNIQDFLEQCLQNNIDPQFCMSWVEQNKTQIPDWQAVSATSLDWVNQHSSTGSPFNE